MEKKCRNVVSSSDMAGADSSSRAPILRMEDVLELDAVTPDPSDSVKMSVEEDDSAGNSGGDDCEDDDQLVGQQVSFQIAAKRSRFARKKRKRKRIVGAEYNSFASDEDLYVENAAEEDCADGEKPAGRKSADAERKPFCKRRSCTCYEYRPKRTDLTRSQCKSCDSDVSNNDSIHSRYQVSSSEAKKTRRKSVDPKLCNCYNREYIGKKYPRGHFVKSSQDNLQVVHPGKQGRSAYAEGKDAGTGLRESVMNGSEGSLPSGRRPNSFRESLLTVLGKLVVWRRTRYATTPFSQPEILRGLLSVQTERKIRANDREFNAEFNYANNYIKTSKYSLLTFLPLNLLEQFQRLANFYFLCLLVLQVIPAISSLTPITTAVPLIGVLSLTAVKDAYDDFQRHRSDSQVNKRRSKVLRDGELVEEKWAQVQVGDVIRMENNQFVAADVLLLSTSEPNGLCYIETAELDGETNLKCRQCLADTAKMGQNDAELGAFKGEITCETPNNLLNKFEGTLSWNGIKYSLDNDKVVLRGCILRNTEWCYGVVIFAGKDTKLMQNSGKTKFKRTSIDRLLNFIIIGIVFFLLSVCLFCMVACGIWETIVGRYFQEYLPWDSLVPKDPVYGATIIALLVLFSYAIVLNTVVPISLYVSVEVIRFAQSFLINWDEKMRCEKTNTHAKARTTTLNEELGQIEYIFSDKTGTLTQNIMTFNKCSIAGVCYGDIMDEGGEIIDNIENVPPLDFSFNKDYEPGFKFYDNQLLQDVLAKNQDCYNFFRLLALCHTVMADERNGRLEYQAQSPDEGALVSAARNFGFVFKERTPNSITIEVMGEKEYYELLCILDFNNVRKRMSVILRRNSVLRLYCKGADSVIYERLKPGSNDLALKTQEHLNKFAGEGLRTLCLAVRDLDESFFNKWKQRHQDAATSLENRDEKLDAIYEEIEKNMTLLGVTAIEDKLQDGVPQTISKLAMADMKLWVLTGDKQETAINIGYSCQLLTDDMADIFIVDGNTHDDVESQLLAHRDAIQKACNQTNETSVSVVTFSSEVDYANGCTIEDMERPPTFAIVVNGHSLVHALHPNLEKLFLEVSSSCRSVICCRVTPLQKALVVEMVKKNKRAVTLAIGDGANDVSMIKAAHIGVGISGQEGMQAVLASDYSIAQFRFLERLLLVHGRWSYYRMCKFLRYFFYKNFAFTLCHFWFAFFCGFSAQTLFDPMFIALYNLFYTSMPVLALGIFDQDVSDVNSLNYPKLYVAGQRNLLFNKAEFIKSAFHGFITSCVIFSIPYGTYRDGISPKGYILSDHMLLGSVVSTILVIVVTAQIAMDTSYWTIFNHLTIWGSLLLYFVLDYSYNYTIQGSYVGTLTMAMSEGMFWFTTIIAVIILTIPVLAWRFYLADIKPSLSDRVRLKQRLAAAKFRSRSTQDVLRTPSVRRTRRSIRSGYAFAHQEGFGRLITSGKIMRNKSNCNEYGFTMEVTDVELLVLETLRRATSQNIEILKPAELKLKEWEIEPGYYSVLLKIFSNHSIDVTVRWLAVTCFKNGVVRYWRKTAPNAIREEEKISLRNGLMETLREPNYQVAIQIATLISKAARYDYPREWPELVPKLVEITKNDDLLMKHRGLLVLYHVIKTLSTKLLVEDRKMFQCLAGDIFSFVLGLWNNNFENFFLQVQNNDPQYHGTLERALLSLKTLRKLIIRGFQHPHQYPDVVLFIRDIFDRARRLLYFRKTIENKSETLLKLTEKTIIHLVKILLSVLDFYPLSYISFIQPSLEFTVTFLFTEHGDGLLFEKFPNILAIVCRKLITHYFLLTREDLELWDSNPEGFERATSDDAGEYWKVSLPACTYWLFVALFHEYREPLSPVLLELIQKNHHLVSPQDMDGILRKDAVYNAIGLAAFDLYDEVDFDQWFSTTLLQELSIKDPNYRVIRRRVAWLIGQWARIKFSPELRPALYGALIPLLQGDEDMAVRLSAASALKRAVDDFQFSSEQFMEFLEPAFSLLFNLLQEVEECDTKLQVLYVLSFIVERMGLAINPYSQSLIRYLPLLWEESAKHNMLRCAIVSTLVRFVRGLITENLTSFLCPVIELCTDLNQDAHVYLLQEGLELWYAVLENTTSLPPQLLQLYRAIPSVLEFTQEYIPSCSCIIQAYILLSPQQFLAEYGESVVASCLNLLTDVNDDGMDAIMQIIETAIRANASLAISLSMPILPKILLHLSNWDYVAPWLMSKFLVIVCRVILHSRDIFSQLLINTARDKSETFDQFLDKLLSVWLQVMPVVPQKEKRKLFALALSSLLSVESNVVIAQFRLVLKNIVEALNDIVDIEDSTTQIDSLMVSEEFTISEELESQQETENDKRQKQLMESDPVYNIELRSYVQLQLNSLKYKVGESGFEELKRLVDPEIIEQCKLYISL
ncbi:UNVERIFIED_CONTAM: hypothetical protein PYX00_008008 [Menopon gallinae]|uniref:P-type phospholipid transporter n=1 Tax=Menopon gallinae TaxID=328185 RepID=A0AAW2HM75_9NEOP